MIKTVLWLLVLAAGFGAMLFSHVYLVPHAAVASPDDGGEGPSALEARLGPAAFYCYWAGLALLLLGGTGVLMRLYRGLLARRSAWRLNSPLVEMYRLRRLLWGLHLAYFGGYLLFALVAYAMPDVQKDLLVQIGKEIQSGDGPLAFAGKAYGSRNILAAAGATVLVNFLGGSLAVITLPSVILPGIGVAIALFRAGIWGLLLSPTMVGLSGLMLPHSFTLLLEGEAYILAAFFALLIPIYLFDRRRGPSAGRRYGRALLLNVKGNLIVLIVLAIAAIYEAIEVIAMMDAPK